MTDRTSGRFAPLHLRRWLAALAFCASVAAAESPGRGLSGEFTVNQLEWQERSGGNAVKWDVSGWVGNDRNRLWLRDEGDHVPDSRVENRVELLWGHPLSWWELLMGIRHDSGETPSRTYAALGGQALVADTIWLEATGYLGDGSDNGNSVHAGGRLQADHAWTIGGHFTLASRAEVEIWSEDHVRYSDGIGPSQVNAGLRLRYALAPRVEPYVGAEWFRLLGDTGRLAEEAGDKVHEARFVAGLHMRF